MNQTIGLADHQAGDGPETHRQPAGGSGVELKMKRAVVILSFVLAWPASSVAQSPAIVSHSGTFGKGTPVTLSVVDAGTKPSNTPWMYDSGEGDVGAQLEPRGWLVHVNTPRPALSSAVVRPVPGRTTSIKLSQTGANVPGFSFGDNGQGGGVEYLSLTAASAPNRRVPPTALLIDYWLYFIDSTASNNYKFMRWHSRFNPTGAGNDYWSVPGGAGASESSMLGNWMRLGPTHLRNRWTHITFLLKWAVGSGNTWVRMYAFQGPGGVVNKKILDTDAQGKSIAQDAGISENIWNYLPAGDRLSTFQFEHQDCTTTGCTRNGAMYLSDIMIDSGYNRVVLSNHPTCTSATVQETQRYTAWPNDDGNLTIVFNPGTFAPGTNAWLHLYNAQDKCSAGYPITVGGSGPSAPTKLRVVPPPLAFLLLAGFTGAVTLLRIQA